MGRNRTHQPVTHYFGYDTETFMGYVKILCASDGQCIEPETEDYTVQLLNWLYNHGDGFFFNIEYDFAAILKPWILKKRKEFKESYKYVIGDFIVRQYPNKAFTIKYKNKKARWFFDIANFFTVNFSYRSLDEVAKEFLNQTKNDKELDIDREKIGTEKGYYEKHRETIRKYCINDAVLTEKLALTLREILEKLNFPTPNKWFSKASISKEFLKRVWSNKREPRLIKPIVKSAYRGGIFQSYYLGHFSDVYDMDINSAYPYAMSLLREYQDTVIHVKSETELTRLTQKLTGLTVSELLDMLNTNDVNKINQLLVKLTEFYGFVHVKMNDFRYYGFRKKKGDSIFYGKVKDKQEIWITYLDYLIQKLFKVEMEFIDAIVIPTKKEKAFPFIQELYNMKDKIKKEYGKESMHYWIIKVIINALYGAVAQHTPKETKFTNYIYASYITASTRFMIRAMQHIINNMNGNVIAISTDGMVATKIPHIESSNELGKWSVEHWNEYVHYMNGIYFYRKNDKWKTKARGYGYLNPDILRNHNDVIYIVPLKKAVKIRTAIRQENKNPAEFVVETRILDPITFYRKTGYKVNENWKIKDFWNKTQKIDS